MNDVRKSILITGANGFVGARLCKKFLTENYNVIAGVRKSADLSTLDGLDVSFRYGDVTNQDSLSEMVKNVDYIIHNAGVVKAKKRQTFFDVNELGTKSLLEAVEQHNPQIKKFIFVSSLAAAGPSLENIPVKESDIPHPITVYGQSKLAGEKKVLEFKDKFPVLALRPSGIYGPGDKEIFSFFDSIHKKVKPYIGNIQRKLQLVHVDDLCDAIYKAVSQETVSGEVYFIAEQSAYTMKRLIELLEEAVGKKGFPLIIPAPIFKVIAFISKALFKLVNATPMLTPEKANELLASWEVSTDKAKKELGFVSQISFLDGAKQTYNWYLDKRWLK